MPDPKSRSKKSGTTKEYEDLTDLICHRTEPQGVDEDDDEDEEDDEC